MNGWKSEITSTGIRELSRFERDQASVTVDIGIRVWNGFGPRECGTIVLMNEVTGGRDVKDVRGRRGVESERRS